MSARHQTTPIYWSIVFWILLLAGAAGNTQAQQVQVTAADPSSTAQGTINLNVKVTGKGFKNGANAKWFVTGTTDPGGVTVNSTAFVNSGELTANITVADTALIGNFDVAVTNPDGRGGKGTELFAVTSSTSCGTDITNLSISIFKYTDATNTTTYNMWPDLTYADGSPVPYVSGEPTGSGKRGNEIDARFQINNCTYDLLLKTAKRYFTWKFPNGSVLGTSVNTGGFNIDRVGDVPVTDGGPEFLTWCSTATDNYGGCGVDGSGGFFVRRAFGSAVYLSGNTSYGVRFNYSPLDGGIMAVTVGTAYVKVYHPDVDTWIIMPDQVPPPPGVTDPSATAGEWSALVDKNTTPYTISSYQKMPLKILVKRL